MVIIVPMFMWSDIKSMVHYIQKRMRTREALKIPFAGQWPRLNQTHNDREWAVVPAPYGTPLNDVCKNKSSGTDTCAHELWVLLDLAQEWSTHSSFTARLSWPASYPADFSIKVYDSETLSAYLGINAQTMQPPSLQNHQRHRYARIRVVDTGVLTPGYQAATTQPAGPVPVPFVLALEPLYFGFLPPSIIPVLGYIVVAIIACCLALPKIYKHLESIALQAKQELATAGDRKCD
ncbi:hypothetical protein H0H81_009498 [Sphagnurus paluster]|uniref:Uncharacterized protein n=1 Tax=Sphagnurus paluster TaxID=117069 RepID=A0A9P7KIJ7_9AGAR|nr:hypothetical protein H0H81_009498 [Sphagnurus paluster]